MLLRTRKEIVVEQLSGTRSPGRHLVQVPGPTNVPEKVLQAVTDSVTLARNLAGDVQWSAEDNSGVRKGLAGHR